MVTFKRSSATGINSSVSKFQLPGLQFWQCKSPALCLVVHPPQGWRRSTAFYFSHVTIACGLACRLSTNVFSLSIGDAISFVWDAHISPSTISVTFLSSSGRTRPKSQNDFSPGSGYRPPLNSRSQAIIFPNVAVLPQKSSSPRSRAPAEGTILPYFIQPRPIRVLHDSHCRLMSVIFGFFQLALLLPTWGPQRCRRPEKDSAHLSSMGRERQLL